VIFKEEEKDKITIVKCASNFFLRELQQNETKMPEEYYWAITLAAGLSRCGRSVSSALEFGF
jgi:hypothetical protein